MPPLPPSHQQHPWHQQPGGKQVCVSLQGGHSPSPFPWTHHFPWESHPFKGKATAKAQMCKLEVLKSQTQPSRGCLGSHPTSRNNIHHTLSCFRFYFRIYKIPVSSILMSLFTCLHIVSKFQS